MRSSYRSISKFGNQQPPCGGTNDPLTVCLTDTSDHKFQQGSIGNLYGPRSRRCQLYMAQRCAEKWDGFCEYFYQVNGENGQWPDNRKWPDMATTQSGLATGGLTTGDQLLNNTAERKYCSYGSKCKLSCEPFDPTNPDSPKIFYHDQCNNCAADCVPVCRVNPQDIDNDPVMNRLLANPTVAPTTMINICNTSRREGTNLEGTKIGTFCNRYFQNMQNMRR